jgi:hypothetical protein
MSRTPHPPGPSNATDVAPAVGFVSLGCPKALVDSEQILTRLRGDGYRVVPTYAEADLVVVNTCGFIDAAVEESLEAIGEALDENGRVIVTGCLGSRAERVRATHPAVLEVTGPHADDAVMAAVHRHLPLPRAPGTLPPQGIRLTPSHYAYLKIAEGCNHRCTFCVIPALRGDLVSRDPGAVLDEARLLVDNGVRELLVVAQDSVAYGVDLRYRPRTASPTVSTCATGTASGAAPRCAPSSPTWSTSSRRSTPGCACTTSIRIRRSMRWSSAWPMGACCPTSTPRCSTPAARCSRQCAVPATGTACWSASSAGARPAPT